LQELKAPDEKFPHREITKAGYGAIWHGQKARNGVAILARAVEPVETRRDLPADADDASSRYVEAAVHGILIGRLYLPNGNPAPGPKFDGKLSGFDVSTLMRQNCWLQTKFDQLSVVLMQRFSAF
jgi:exodeoxyribonuclease III